MKDQAISNNKDKITDNKDKDNITKSIKATLLFLASSLGTKVINLLFGAMLLRYVSKESYSLSKVELEFLYLLIQFVPIATMKAIFQKYCSNKDSGIESKRFKETLNITIYLNYFLVVISIILSYVFIISKEKLQENKIHIIIFSFMSLVQCFLEPVIAKMNLTMELKKKITAVSILNYTKIFVTFGTAYFFSLELWCFSIGISCSVILYSIYLIYVYKVFYKESIFSLFIVNYSDNYDVDGIEINKNKETKEGNSNDYNELKQMFKELLSTNFLSMILTHFEKFVLKFFMSMSDEEKGEYHFVHDNFSIIVRYFYQPIEENFYILVNKIKSKDKEKDIAKDSKLNESSSFNSLNLLFISLRFLIIFSILLLLYFNITGIEVLTIVYTKKWISPNTISLLKPYSLYVAILSINGIIESYSTAVIDLNTLKVFKYLTIVKSLILIFFNYYFTMKGYGTLGLILTSIILKVFGIICNIILASINVFDLMRFSFMRLKTFFCCLVMYINMVLFKVYFTNINTFAFVGFCMMMFGMNCFIIYFLEKNVIVNLINLNIIKGKSMLKFREKGCSGGHDHIHSH